MGFLRQLFGRKSGSAGQEDRDALYLYARCERCKALVHTRINLRHDLSPDNEGGYLVRKTLVDDRCFQRMEALICFDTRRRVIEQRLEGGSWLSRSEFEAQHQTPMVD